MSYFKGIDDDTRFPYSLEEENDLYESLILDSESATSNVFAGSVGYTPRKMATTRDIYRFWGKTLVQINKFDSLFEVEDGNHTICWACGMCDRGQLERAHILPRNMGGSDEASNLHMLCPTCHKMSEFSWGREYWTWFRNPWKQDNPVNIMFVGYMLNKWGICSTEEYLTKNSDEDWLKEINVKLKERMENKGDTSGTGTRKAGP